MFGLFSLITLITLFNLYGCSIDSENKSNHSKDNLRSDNSAQTIDLDKSKALGSNSESTQESANNLQPDLSVFENNKNSSQGNKLDETSSKTSRKAKWPKNITGAPENFGITSSTDTGCPVVCTKGKFYNGGCWIEGSKG